MELTWVSLDDAEYAISGRFFCAIAKYAFIEDLYIATISEIEIGGSGMPALVISESDRTYKLDEAKQWCAEMVEVVSRRAALEGQK